MEQRAAGGRVPRPTEGRGPEEITPELTLERDATIWRMRTREGLTQTTIMLRLHEMGIGISQSAISESLRRQRRRIAESLVGEQAGMVAEQLAQLEHVVEESLEAWRSSEGPVEEVTIESGLVHVDRRWAGGEGGAIPGAGDEDGVIRLPDRVRRTTKILQRDNRHIQSAMEAMAAQRKLLGLEAPTRTDVTSGGRPMAAIGYEVLPPAGVTLPEEEGE